MLPALPLIILSLLAAVQAITISGSISLNAGANATVPLGGTVTLDHGASTALIDRNGGFKLYDVQEGEHIISAHLHGWAFPSMFVMVPSTGEPHIQIHHPGKIPLPTSSPSLRYPIVLTALGKEDYYTVKTGVNILAMLKNPIVLMMLASGLMMFVLPKMMASMEADPEMKKEMAEARKMISGKQSDIAGGMANMLQGSRGGGSGSNTPNAPRMRK